MSYDDRSGRLNAAAEMLLLLKISGCTQRFIAAYLGVSHARLSRWNCTEEDSDRRTGVPSNEQVVKLAALVQHQIEAIAQGLMMSVDALEFQPGGEYLFYALESSRDEFDRVLNLARERRARSDAIATKIESALGARKARQMLQPEAAAVYFPETDQPSASMQEAHAKAAAAAAAEVEAKRVTREDAAAAKRALDEWCKTHDTKIRERRIRRRRSKSSDDSETG